MPSASNHLLLFILLLFKTLIASKSKLLKNDMSQFLGEFLQPESVQKMKQTSKQWSEIKIIYENIFPKKKGMVVFRNVNTEEIMWETIKFTKFWKPLRKHIMKKLVSHLRRKDAAKWNSVFVWFVDNRNTLIQDKFRIDQFLKTLIFTTAEIVDVTFIGPHGYSILMISAMFGDSDSILSLIHRGADVNQQNNYGEASLHFAAENGDVNACATLLDENAKIDVSTHDQLTPLMFAALNGKKNVFEFLILKGANETLTDIDGQTASQLATFERR